MNPNWLNDNRLQYISLEKRNLLLTWLKEHQTSKQTDLLTNVLTLNSILKQRNLTFSNDEQTILWNIIEDYMSPSEKQQLTLIKSLMPSKK